jgi:diguanylate cyclase (GGDEF)-like protein
MKRHESPRVLRWVSILVASVTLLGVALIALSSRGYLSFVKYDAIARLYRLPVGSPVRLQAVVTYADPAGKRFWIQDESGAIAIDQAPGTDQLHGGESIQLSGTKALISDPVRRTNRVSVADVRIISIPSTSKLPAPANVLLKDLPGNERTGTRVRLTGVVRQVTRDQLGAVQLAFGDTGQEIPVTLGIPPDDSSRWLNASVDIVGVAESFFDDNGKPTYQHVWVLSGDDVQLQESAPLPKMLSIRALYRDSRNIDGHRVLLQARVTAQLTPSSLLLEDRWGAIACEFDEPHAVALGTAIEVAGFPTAVGPRTDLLHSIQSPSLETQTDGDVPTDAWPQLTTVASIRNLDTRHARDALPVKLTGVITYNDTAWRQLFLQDATGGIFMKYPGTATPLSRGDRVTVTGITGGGDYAPVVAAPAFVLLGKSPLPTSIPATARDASSGKLDSQFVEVEGVVHAIEPGQDARHSRFELYSPFGQVQVFTGPSFVDAERLHSIEDAAVSIRGVFGTLFNSNRQLAGYQLSLASLSDVKILEPSESNLAAKAPIPLNSLLRFSPKSGFSHRIKVRGSVTMVGKGFFYMQDESGGLQVVADSSGVKLSDIVESIGYPTPSGNYSPALTDAKVQVVGHGDPILPSTLTAGSALQGQLDSRLGTIDARLLSVADTTNGKILVMQSGALTFSAEFDERSSTRPLPRLQEGSLLRLTGVCSIQVDSGKLYLLLVQEPLGFKLLIRTSDDIKVLKAPDWWNTSHAIAVFGILLAAICAVLTWVTILRRRVRRQVHALNEANESATSIRDLAHAMQKVTLKGDFNERVSIGGKDEIALLGIQFNTMLVELQQRDLGKKEAEARLTYQALTDELTGLPNRRLLSDRLSQALATAKRESHVLAILYIDVDGFKLVNDSFGHRIGDLLLGQVADRLRQRIRESDTLARLGGDEFTMVLNSLHHKQEAELVARSLLDFLSRPFLIDHHEITISASIGISVFPDDGCDASDLLQLADIAMYTAKRKGKNQSLYFTPAIGSVVRDRLSLENQLRGASVRGEIKVHYQPEFDAQSGDLVRFEALARWIHPTLGTIPPYKFIPIAEESGLIIPFGAYIMERACEEAVKWQAISNHPLQVAVNVSSLQFMRDTFVLEVTEILQRAGLEPRLLQIELTESVMLSGTERAARVMRDLRELGVSIALDDFGTGYSCLGYLPRLPFSFLKIDRSFVNELELPETEAMVHSLITLAHNLKMKVIAEGIETPLQLDVVRRLGVNEVQGFLLGRPTATPQSEIRSIREKSSPHFSLGQKSHNLQPGCDPEHQPTVV